MTEYTQEEAVFRMNEMGKAGRPFLFIIDYKRERIYVCLLYTSDAADE